MEINISKFYQLLIMGVLFAPIIVVFTFLFKDSGDIWQHIQTYLLSDYILTTLYLGLGVGICTFFIGSLTAWITSAYEFKGRKLFEWALILPLSFPAYIAAYMYGNTFGISGWVNKFLVHQFSLTYKELEFLDVMNTHGAIFVMSFVFYPYVYLMTKTAFKHQSFTIFEAAKVHGYNEAGLYLKIFLPAMRPAIAAGVFLSVMEAISDFGVVSYFGVTSFVNGIFKAWTDLGNLEAATKLASMLMLFVFILMWVERILRKRAKYSASQKGFKPIVRKKLSSSGTYIALFICFLPLLFGFILPGWQLCKGFILTYHEVINDEYLTKMLNTFLLAFITALLTTIFGFILIYLAKKHPNLFSKLSEQVAKLGYSIPGAVVGVGILIVFSKLDDFYISLSGASTVIFSGSVLGLVYGYSVRFLAVSCGSIEGGYSKIPNSYSDAAKIMGYSGWEILKKIDFILLKGTFGASLILVFVEILKELPLTLILRPFDFETLSTYAMELSSQEMIAETSVPSLSIVIMAMIPTILLIKTMIKD